MNRFGIATITSDGNPTLEMYSAFQDGESGLHYVRSPYSFTGIVYFKANQTIAPAKNGNNSMSLKRTEPLPSYSLLHPNPLLGYGMDIFGWKTTDRFVPSNQPYHNDAPSVQSSCYDSPSASPSSLHNDRGGALLYTIMTVGNQVNLTRVGQTPSPLLNVAPCDHINDWKRLRGKHGQGQYACLRCGAKWRTAHSYHSLLASLSEK